MWNLRNRKRGVSTSGSRTCVTFNLAWDEVVWEAVTYSYLSCPRCSRVSNIVTVQNTGTNNTGHMSWALQVVRELYTTIDWCIHSCVSTAHGEWVFEFSKLLGVQQTVRCVQQQLRVLQWPYWHMGANTAGAASHDSILSHQQGGHLSLGALTWHAVTVDGLLP